MSTNSQTLDAIYNEGERLVPGETHGRDEVVRHKSSYQLFRDVIEADILRDPSMLVSGFTILDIGCGTGHGTFMLSDILGAQITGIDPSIESVQYAKDNYGAKNIQYVNGDAESFVRESRSFDYVVSRHALEHVVDGLNFALKVDCRKRLMVNVPFNEGDGNVHHLVHWIKEEQFEAYPNKEFFYEGLDGVTELTRTEENPPNSILCISSAPELKPVRELFEFPIAAWKPEFLQNLGIESLESDIEQRELNIQQTAAQIQTREQYFIEKEAQLDNHHSNLRDLENDIRRREAWVAEKETQLATHETNLAGIQAELATREKNLAGLQADLVRREQIIANSMIARLALKAGSFRK